MGLYLMLTDGQGELSGIEVGHNSDFALFRNTVLEKLEPNGRGTRFPTLMLHSDCSGEWIPSESRKLAAELEEIAARFKELPPWSLFQVGRRTWQKLGESSQRTCTNASLIPPESPC
jgi:hypothetical protein